MRGDDRYGSVEVGMEADLMLVKGSTGKIFRTAAISSMCF